MKRVTHDHDIRAWTYFYFITYCLKTPYKKEEKLSYSLNVYIKNIQILDKYRIFSQL